MLQSEVNQLWDSVQPLCTPGGTVGIIGTHSRRTTLIGAEGTARNYDVVYLDDDAYIGGAEFSSLRDWYKLETVIVADYRGPHQHIPPHVSVIDTACVPWEEWGHVIADYRWWDGKNIVSHWDKHNHPPVNSFPDGGAVCISNDFFEVYPELWYKRHSIGFIYYGPTPHQGDPSRVPYEQQLHNIQTLLDRGCTTVMFCNSDEALQLVPTGWAHRVARHFVKQGHSPDTFWFITGCLTGEAEYATICEQGGEPEYLNPLTWHRFEHCVRIDCTGVSSIPHMRHSNTDFEPGELEYPLDDESQHILDYEYVQVPKKHKFLCFSRMPRWQRIQLLAWLEHNDYLNSGLMSFDLTQGNRPGNNAENAQEIEHLTQHINHMYNYDLEHCEADQREAITEFRLNCAHYTIDSFMNIGGRLPLTLNRTVERDNPVQICLEDRSYHENSRFSIVCETLFYRGDYRSQHDYYMNNLQTLPGIFISEKLYKPLSYCHPFVLFSRPGTLQALRDRGYHTFGYMIDEHYDDIEDDARRFGAVCTQIQRLITMSDEQFAEYQPKIADTVHHNRNVLMDFSQGNTLLAVTDTSRIHGN